jgi:hypothetical protein
MRAVSIMKHRTVIERVIRSSDTGGGFNKLWSSIATDIRCFAWYVSGVMVSTSTGTKVVDTRMVMVPLATDIHEGDRLKSVTSKNGQVLFDGPLMVDAVGERPDHLLLTTRKVA